MTTYALHFARSSGLADVLYASEDKRSPLMYVLTPRGVFASMRRARPLLPPRGPAPGRPLRPGARRPGRPGAAGGSGGGAGKAMALAVAAAAVGKLWEWRWYFATCFGCYVLVRCVKYVWQRIRANNTEITASLGESVDGRAILSAYVLEILKKNECPDLDLISTTSSFSCAEIPGGPGPSVALYCIQHLHLKVLNHLNGNAPFMQVVRDAMDSMKHMMSININQMDADGYVVNEVGNGVSFCGLSNGNQGIALLINQELGDKDCWDCCSRGLHEPTFVERSDGGMSFMAARRFSSGTLLDIIPGDPSFIVLACDGICNLVQNMCLLEFAYQGVRNDMPLRPLCEFLLDLMKASSIKIAVLLVQFQQPIAH